MADWVFGTRRLILAHAEEDRAAFAELRNTIIARDKKDDARHEDNLTELKEIKAALAPLTDIAPTLKLVAKERRTVASVAWVVTKIALWFVGVFGLIATMAGAWPVLVWAAGGLWSALKAHLAS